MDIEFRSSNVEDAEQIIHVKANAFKEEVKIYGHGPNEMDSVDEEREFIRNIEGNNFSYVLIDKGQIIGGMGGVNKGNGVFYLGCVYVKLEYQNKGIGDNEVLR